MNRLICFFFLLTISVNLNALTVPKLTGPVVDHVRLLSPEVNGLLEKSLYDLRKRTGVQFQILIIDSLEDESLEGFSIKVVDQWKLGGEKSDSGVLFLMAMKERKMRLEAGQGLEGVLTDAKTGRIISQASSYFKKGDFDTGIMAITGGVFSALGVDFSKFSTGVSVKKRRRGKSGNGFVLLIVLFFLVSMFGRGRRSGGGIFNLILLGSILGGRGSSGGGGGFSGWSGGGGGFSGGGASGGW